MNTLLYVACITVAWASAPGPVAGYRVAVGDLPPTSVAVAQAVVCVREPYTEAPVTVAAFDADGNTGPWSDPLVLKRLHDFDADGDGVVGFSDFGRFTAQAGRCYAANGVIEPCP